MRKETHGFAVRFLQGLAIVTTFSLQPAVARPRPPVPLPPEVGYLCYQRFDEPWITLTNQAADAETWAESWSGYALNRRGVSVSPWLIPALDASARPNIGVGEGTIRFWFRPDWTSAQLSGDGPGHWVRLLEAATIDGNLAIRWSIYTSPDGSTLYWSRQGANGPQDVLSCGVEWAAGDWHLVALTYTATNTALFLDAELAASGAGLPAVPTNALPLSVLALGSGIDGTQTAEGQFEEFTASSRIATAASLQNYWAICFPLATLGPVSLEEDEARQQFISLSRGLGLRTSFALAGTGPSCLDASLCGHGGQVYLTNLTSVPVANHGSTVAFDVAGGWNGTNYFLYRAAATNLAAAFTNSAWQWVGIIHACDSVTLTDQPASGAFYLVGFDASKDSDGDGMPDVWEVANGLDPLANDAAADPDDDGTTNLAEYNQNSNPFDNMLIAWGDNYFHQNDVPFNLPRVGAMAGGAGHSAGGHTLLLTPQGTVLAWGDNTHGQTNVPSAATNVVAVAAGGNQSLALQATGKILAWGQVYDTSYASLTNVTAISAGFEHGLALLGNGTVAAWGAPNSCGNQVPPGLSGIKAISAGWNHNVALRSNGTVAAWGLAGQSLGWNLTNVPPGLSGVAAISAGALHSAALLSNGTVVAWGNNAGGETNVPAGLSNVAAIAAGRGYTLALRADRSVVSWGLGQPARPDGLDNMSAIAAGPGHGMGARGGVLTPLITHQPKSLAMRAGSTATFAVTAASRSQPAYQWYRSNTLLAATATLTLQNVQASTEGGYHVLVSNRAGTVSSQVAEFQLVTQPVLVSPTQAQTLWVMAGSNFNLSVTAQAGGTKYEPLRYQWFLNGHTPPFNLPKSNYTAMATAASEGVYTVTITNSAGSTTAPPWTVRVAAPGSVAAWGRNDAGQTDRPLGLSEVIAVAAGGQHSLALNENGTVTAWGGNASGQTNVPAGLTNVISIAAGAAHSLAVVENTTVVAWGGNDAGQTNVPANLTNVSAVSAGGGQSLALLSNGTVVQWGYTNSAIPAGLSGVTAIASGTNFHLALSNRAVVAWGANNSGQLNVPTSASNIVAVAAGGTHALALREDGHVVAWGNNAAGQTAVPSYVTNAMAVAAGDSFSLALLNDSTVVAWGDNTSGQTSVIAGLSGVKSIAAGHSHALAVLFSLSIRYPVNVTRDLLLICNTNSAGSIWVKDYYLTHRPMVQEANVLLIGCTTNEIAIPEEFTNQIAIPFLNWLTSNPTKRPLFLVCFQDIPTIVHTNNNISEGYPNTMSHPSVGVGLRQLAPGITPFVNYIAFQDTNACKGYIDKLEEFGRTYSPGLLVISPRNGGYRNTTYLVDDNRQGYSSNEGYDMLSVLFASAPNALAVYVVANNNARITNGNNVAGYFSWGTHNQPFLQPDYATDGSIRFGTNSGWYVITTIESFNGQRDNLWFGTYAKWAKPNAFGGDNYSNIPMGMTVNVSEPGSSGGCNGLYDLFALWEQGLPFANCAWGMSRSKGMLAIGDPLIVR